MGFYIRRSKKINEHLSVNLSKSGLSLTARLGRLTVNSRGRVNYRLGRGFGWRSGR